MKKSILIGMTKDGEGIVLEIDTDNTHTDKPYFSISGETYNLNDLITSEDEGKQRAREYLEDDYLWKESVQSGDTKLGKDEWIEMVLDVDGWETVLGDIYEIGESKWCFLGSCGQIDVPDSEEFTMQLIPKEELEKIKSAWKKIHLKELAKMTITERNQVADVEKIFEGHKDFEHTDLGGLLSSLCPKCGKAMLSLVECRWCGYQIEQKGGGET